MGTFGGVLRTHHHNMAAIMPAAMTHDTLRRTIAVGWLLGLALSWRLWTASRLFPLAPVSDALPRIDPPLDGVVFAVLVALLLAVVARPRARVPAMAVLAIVAALAMLDQTRWQPWAYQYFVMLAACVWLPADGAADACRTIVAFTYVWSGLQKVNVTFVRQTWPDLMAALHGALPGILPRPSAPLALLIPAVEVIAGLGLLTRRFRTPAAALALLTHAVILMALIRLGANTVVWPWNLAMIVFVLTLFWRNRVTAARDLLIPRRHFHRAIVVLFGVLPALSFVRLWDSYLSMALYSGNTYKAAIEMEPGTAETLPAEIRPAIRQLAVPFVLDVKGWAYRELNVPGYPEPRVYRAVAQRVCEWGRGAEDLTLKILAPPHPLTGARAAASYDCRHLRNVE